MTLDQIIHTQKRVRLSNGEHAMVDAIDWEALCGYSWHKDARGYAYRHQWCDGKDHPVRMHRQILSAKPGEDTDHINGDKLDNRRSNLRLCSRRQNLWNSGKKMSNKSGFKGVDFRPTRGKFRARIRIGDQRLNLGHFDKAEDAYAAYCYAAVRFHGQFAQV